MDLHKYLCLERQIILEYKLFDVRQESKVFARGGRGKGFRGKYGWGEDSSEEYTTRGEDVKIVTIKQSLHSR